MIAQDQQDALRFELFKLTWLKRQSRIYFAGLIKIAVPHNITDN